MFVYPIIDTTDVQMFDAQLLNGTDNLGAINCIVTVAINSSILEFMVNIFGSSGKKFDGIHIVRQINQRVVSGRTMVLPVDTYTLSLSVLTSSGFQYANFTTTVNISRSNYSASTTTTITTTTTTTTTSTAAAATTAAPTSTPSPTPISAPVTLGELGGCLLS